MRVVLSLDEVEDRHTRLDLILEAGSIEELAFECGEEALAHRIVIRIADRAHRGPHAHLAASKSEGDGGVLAALIGVVITPSGRRCSSAMLSASRTRSVLSVVPIAQPTTLRLQASITTER